RCVEARGSSANEAFNGSPRADYRRGFYRLVDCVPAGNPEIFVGHWFELFWPAADFFTAIFEVASGGRAGRYRCDCAGLLSNGGDENRCIDCHRAPIAFGVFWADGYRF